MSREQDVAGKLGSVYDKHGHKITLRVGDTVTFHREDGTVSFHRGNQRLFFRESDRPDNKALLFQGGSLQDAAVCRTIMEKILDCNLVHDTEADGPSHEVWRLTARS